MKLQALIEKLKVKKIIQLDPNKEVIDLIYNSKKAKKDTIFFAMVGTRVDGHKFIKDVETAGCDIIVLSDASYIAGNSTYILVEDTREALAYLSNIFFAEPSKNMTVVGITGTKGKTTIANYIKYIMDDNDKPCGIIGTNGIFYLDKEISTPNTTPESYEIQKALRQMLDSGVKNVVMEVSSLGLKCNRVSHLDFDIGIFTNLSPDHIGENEHESFEDYMLSKAKLFELAKKSIINIDDEYANVMQERTKNCKTYGLSNGADYTAINIVYPNSLDDMKTYFDIKDESYSVNSFGSFGVYNALCTVACLKELGYPYEKIKKSLNMAYVKGRLQVLDVLEGRKVIIDYAHNEVSLENLLSNIKTMNPKRIITIFGSIGTRAKHRRQELAEVSSKYSDLIIVTSDNPDIEDPLDIIKQILSFIPEDKKNSVFSFVDRDIAIKKAIELSKEGDVIVIAGKGHEEYQLINGERVHFSDYETVLKYAKNVD